MIGKSVVLQILLREMKLAVVIKHLRISMEYNIGQDVLQTYYTNYLFLFLTNL